MSVGMSVGMRADGLDGGGAVFGEVADGLAYFSGELMGAYRVEAEQGG
jgi:hypothetical protein